MERLFDINAEGGPLLCLDSNAARTWHGAVGEGTDYSKLCDLFEALPDSTEAVMMEVDGIPSISWEMRGGGTAVVFQRSNGSIRIVRPWVDDDSDEEIERLAAADSPSYVDIGEISIPSRFLVVMWAPESGENVPVSIEQTFEVVEDTAMDSGVVVLKVAHDRYRCRHDDIDLGISLARRLTLIPQ